jgi:hypothetical protein
MDPGLDEVDALILAERLQLWPSWNVARRIDALSAYSGLQPIRLNALETTFGLRWSEAARRFSVTHVLRGLPARREEVEAGIRAVVDGVRIHVQDRPPLEVWSVPHAPWASFATRARAVPSPGAAFQAVVAMGRLDLWDDVVVEAPAAPPTAPGRVLAVARGTEETRIEAETAADGLLVVRDAYWPGWRASVDGFEVPILATDLLVRAAPWPAGRHELVMRYEPPEVRVGGWLSAVGLLATLALAAFEARRLRPRPPASTS